MEFRVLGPLEVVSDGEAIKLGPPQERAVLATLLLHANERISTDTIADVMWGDDPPATATNLVQGYVSAIRRRLGPDRVLSERPGYRLLIESDEIDAWRFARLGEEGRSRQALALWRGLPYEEIAASAAAAPEVARLTELRLSLSEAVFEADIDAGHHAAAVGAVEAFLAEYPLRERAWELLLLALYRSGRQADALRAYQRARSVLRDELGIDPGPSLQAMEAAILRHDADLDKPTGGGGGGIVVLLFTDVVASTELLESVGDEDAELVRRRHFRLLRDAVVRYGGQEVKSLGDGIMAVFDSVVKALDCSSAIHLATARGEDPTLVRIGVHAGEPIADEEDYFGTSVVIARRLCDAAPPGSTLVSGLVRGLAGSRGGFVFEPQGPTRLKGLRQEIETFTVEWRRRLASPIALPAHLGRGDRRVFAGRERETATLEGLWAQAAAGTPQFAMVTGEPGIGKTRLTAEFATAVHAAGGIVLFGECGEDTAIPYQPFAVMLSHCASAELDLSDVVFAEQLGRLTPALGEAPRESPSDADRRQLFEAISSLLATLAERAPVLVIVDDLHWADASTLQLFRHLAGDDTVGRVLLLGVYRDTELARTHPLGDALADLRRGGGFERIRLGGLGEGGVAEMATAWGGSGWDPEFIAEVYRQTDGVPFFVEELIWHRQESGEHGVPEGVKEVVGKRLSLLSDDANHALRTASALGDDFDAGLLEALTGLPEGALVDPLAEAVSARVLVESGVDRYRFAHAIFRATLRNEFSTSQRVRLHLAAAEALEKLRPDAVDAIAYHYGEAAPLGVQDRAADWASRAGRGAMRQLAYEQAVAWLERALAETRDPALRVERLLELAAAQHRAGERASAEANYREGADLARRSGDAEQCVRAALGLADWSVLPGADPTGYLGDLLADALPTLPGGDSLLRAKATVRVAYERSRGAVTDELADLARAGVAMAREHGDARDLAWCLESYLYVLWDVDHNTERTPAAAEIIDLGRRAGDEEWVFIGNFWSAVIGLERGDVAAFDIHRLELTAIAERLRQPRLRAFCTLLGACRAVLEGRWDDAERLGQENFEQGENEYPLMNFSFHAARILRVAHDRGDMADIIEPIDAALSGGDMLSQADIRAWRAWALASAGRAEPAREALRLVLHDPGVDVHSSQRLTRLCLLAETAATLRATVHAAHLYDLLAPHRDRWAVPGPAAVTHGAASLYLGMLAITLDRHADAVHHLEHAAAAHEDARAYPLLARTRHHLAIAHAALGHHGEARRQSSAALELATAHGLAQFAEGSETQRSARPTPSRPAGS